MTVGRKISLTSQIAEVDHWAARLREPGFKGRSSEAELHVAHTAAVRATLVWLHNYEPQIRAFLALAPDVRAAVLSHGPIVGELAVEIARREAIAKAGGPVR